MRSNRELYRADKLRSNRDLYRADKCVQIET